jgi:two-component system, LuxR family, sensor kinase FixL
MDTLERDQSAPVGQEKSEEARERLAAIVDSSDDAIISKNLDGIIMTWNVGAEKIFGYTAEEAIGRPVAMLIPEERLDEEPHILGRVRRGERIDHYETVRRRKDGTLINISLTVSPIVNVEGKIIGASKIARDISDRKRLEAELRNWHNELESRVSALKGQLLQEAKERKRLESEVAEAVEAEQLRLGQELHDGLAQELTGIGMLLEVVEQKCKKSSATRARELRRLRAKLASATVNARNLAKGFYPVEIEKHGLLVALQEFAWQTEHAFGISCAVETDDQTLTWLKDAPAIQLFRIAQEAVHNASKHAKAKHILIKLEAKEGKWALTVKDDGIGLCHDLHQTSGMGLRIMQYRARMIKGTCEIRNHKNGGVVFSCHGPAEQDSGFILVDQGSE